MLTLGQIESGCMETPSEVTASTLLPGRASRAFPARTCCGISQVSETHGKSRASLLSHLSCQERIGARSGGASFAGSGEQRELEPLGSEQDELFELGSDPQREVIRGRVLPDPLTVNVFDAAALKARDQAGEA